VCESLDLRSFLLLPLQRVTRYPLLLGALAGRLPHGPARLRAESAARIATNVARDCDEGARRLERLEQLLVLERQLRYDQVNSAFD